MVYAVGVGGSAIPVYNKLQKLHIPRFGYSDILPKYANATGGGNFSEFFRVAIERADAPGPGGGPKHHTPGSIIPFDPRSSHREGGVKGAPPHLTSNPS